MALWRAMYKCRNCGETFASVGCSSGSVANALVALEDKSSFSIPNCPISIGLRGIHFCGPHMRGIADFVGFEEEPVKMIPDGFGGFNLVYEGEEDGE